MQKPLVVFVGSVVVGLTIVIGCSAPSPEGSNLGGTRGRPSGSSGTSGSSGDEGDGGTSGTTSGGPAGNCSNHAKVSDRAACDTCTKAKCCTEILACDNDADCKAIQQCFEACAPGDDTCGLICLTAHDKGADTLQSVSSCATTKCAAECPSSVPDAGNDPFGDF